jgi:hypothetical protein
MSFIWLARVSLRGGYAVDIAGVNGDGPARLILAYVTRRLFEPSRVRPDFRPAGISRGVALACADSAPPGYFTVAEPMVLSHLVITPLWPQPWKRDQEELEMPVYRGAISGYVFSAVLVQGPPLVARSALISQSTHPRSPEARLPRARADRHGLPHLRGANL